MQSSGLSPVRRWALVDERLRALTRAASPETKLLQLSSLMDSVDDFGWRDALGADDQRVRELWMKLRAVLPRA